MPVFCLGQSSLGSGYLLLHFRSSFTDLLIDFLYKLRQGNIYMVGDAINFGDTLFSHFV